MDCQLWILFDGCGLCTSVLSVTLSVCYGPFSLPPEHITLCWPPSPRHSIGSCLKYACPKQLSADGRSRGSNASMPDSRSLAYSHSCVHRSRGNRCCRCGNVSREIDRPFGHWAIDGRPVRLRVDAFTWRLSEYLEWHNFHIYSREYLVQLVLLGCAREQRLARKQLGNDACGTPDVHGAVVRLAEQHFGRPIPERDHLHNVWRSVNHRPQFSRSQNTYHRCQAHLKVVRFGQPKVGQLQVALRRHEYVLRLEVPMDDAMRVQEIDAGQKFARELLQSSQAYRNEMPLWFSVWKQGQHYSRSFTCFACLTLMSADDAFDISTSVNTPVAFQTRMSAAYRLAYYRRVVWTTTNLYGFCLHAAVWQRLNVAGQILLEMLEHQEQHQLTFAFGALAVANVQ